MNHAEADKPSVEGLMDDLGYAVLARSQGHGSNARIKECRERLASAAAPAAQPATPLREVLSDERLMAVVNAAKAWHEADVDNDVESLIAELKLHEALQHLKGEQL